MRELSDNVGNGKKIDWINNSIMNIIIFGAGQKGKLVKNTLEKHQVSVSYFVDNDQTKQGTFFEGIKVISPNRLYDLDLSKSQLLICSQWAEQIAEQLYDMKIHDFVIVGDETLNDKYICPVCSHSVSNFQPVDKKFIQYDFFIENKVHTKEDFETFNSNQYACPICGSSDRERLYALYIRQQSKKIDLSGQLPEIIHFAPEVSLAKMINKYKAYNYLSADLYMKHVDLNIDITNMLAISNESTDAFLCSHVLEHIVDDRAALKELYRILKYGGWGILMVPILLTIDEVYEDFTIIEEKERLLHFGQEDHVRVYSKKGFIERVESVGFNIKQLDATYFKGKPFTMYGINEKSVLYVVEK